MCVKNEGGNAILAHDLPTVIDTVSLRATSPEGKAAHCVAIIEKDKDSPASIIKSIPNCLKSVVTQSWTNPMSSLD